MADNITCAELRRLRSRLAGAFSSKVEHNCLKCRELIEPELGRFSGERLEQAKSERRLNKVIMNTAQQANQTLASGLQAGLTSPTQQWFLWRPSNVKLMEQPGVRQWFDDVQSIMYNTLASSNFYQSMHAADTELGAFGMFCVLMEEDDKNDVRFTQVPAGSFYWANDARNMVDTVVRIIEWTPRQLEQKFGKDAMSQGAREKLETNPDDGIECVHVVMPRETRNKESDLAADMAFGSYIFEAANDNEEQFLHVGGYREFPYLIARWFQYSTDVYSTTWPGYTALGDIRQLQQQAITYIKMAQKMADPPMRVPAGYKGRLKIMPGGQNAVSQNDPNAVSPLYQLNPATLSPLQNWIAQVLIPSIEKHFFKDVFMMFADEDKVRTATEIIERKQEKMLLLGPVIERYIHTALDPCIYRLFTILLRRGKIPPVPAALNDQDANVEYISILAQAQKAAMRTSITAFMEFVGSIYQVKPDVLDKIDIDQVADEMHKVLGAPASILRDDDAVKTIRDARLQAERARQRLASAQAYAQLGETAGKIPVKGDTMTGKAGEIAGVS